MRLKRRDDSQALTLAFYEKHAEEYIRSNSSVNDATWLERFACCVGPGSRILDAGCGSGRHSEWFCRNGFVVYAIDLSSRMISLARARGKDSQFIVMDVTCLDFPNQFFHGVWCNLVLTNLSKQRQYAAMTEMRRVLSDRGLLYVQVKKGTGVSITEDAHYGGDSRYSYSFTTEEISCLVARSDFVLDIIVDESLTGSFEEEHQRIHVLARKG